MNPNIIIPIVWSCDLVMRKGKTTGHRRNFTIHDGKGNLVVQDK